MLRTTNSILLFISEKKVAFVIEIMNKSLL